VAGGAAQDGAGNGNVAATQFTIENDETGPTVALTTGSADPVSGAFTITATFSEAVTGFAIGDFSVGNGAASSFSATSATVYTA
ncbi:Ig-like domain-containing protein, partial [Maricaulis maris]|uniref:Ig-like domain-containing protein n=1 Tax=Maricaulis maris TaxID=74318 RepID=UPI003B8E0287